MPLLANASGGVHPLAPVGSVLCMVAGLSLILAAYLTPEWAVNDAADVQLGPIRACSSAGGSSCSTCVSGVG